MKNNESSLYKLFLGATIASGILSLLAGFLVALYSSRISYNAVNDASSRSYISVVAALVTANLEISNYRDIQSILGSLNNSDSEHAVIDASGEIVLADFSSYQKIRSVVSHQSHLRCNDIPSEALVKFPEGARVICEQLISKNDGSQIGLILVFKRNQGVHFSFDQFLFVFSALGLIFLIAMGIMHLFAKRKLIRPLQSLLSNIQQSKLSKSFSFLEDLREELPAEYRSITLHFKELFEQLRSEELKKNLAEKETAKMIIISELASQVSHDIRSPLSALSMVTSQLKDIPENNRLLIRNSVQRITDIANELLSKGKQLSVQSENSKSKKNGNTAENPLLKVELISPIIDSLVSEKRVQFREKQNIEIDADINLGYGLFASVNPSELRRTLSNVLNNAIEALPEAKGKVTVAIRGYSKLVCIIVQDNGKGIPEHILKKLGEMGVTHGKEGTQSGSGLGVYHAKKTVESFGGKFEISSRENEGTTITMSFPKAPAPKWFVEKLVLKPHMQIVSIDDDLTIHQVWKGRFESKKVSDFGIEHLTFTSGDEVKAWVRQDRQSHERALKSSRLYLVDYELLNQSATGLEIIEELGIGTESILVTSRYEEDRIREKCEKLGVSLIPKAMAGFVPMEIKKPKERFDAILIDDDVIPHSVWQMMAQDKGKRFLGFYSFDEFLKRAGEFDLTTPLYIDSNLSDGIKGEEVSKQAYTLGFENIYLCTGYEANQFPPMNHLKGIVSKDPVF